MSSSYDVLAAIDMEGVAGHCFYRTHPHHYGRLVPKHAAYHP